MDRLQRLLDNGYLILKNGKYELSEKKAIEKLQKLKDKGKIETDSIKKYKEKIN